ncbi:MAG: hypothetical protein AAFV95_08045 [Bacteroidota bacterium]
MHNTGNTKNRDDKPELVEIIHQLIHSKIEYIEHEQEFLYRSFDELNQLDIADLENVRSEKKLKSLKVKFDDFIQRVEQLSYARNLLLVIRSFLKLETAQAIYELLTNDKYLFYSPKSLQRLLGLETYINGYAVNAIDN